MARIDDLKAHGEWDYANQRPLLKGITVTDDTTPDLEAAIDRILVRYFAPAVYQNGNGVATKILAALRPAGVGEAPRCQRCGGEVQGWCCQSCPAEFRENDDGFLIFDEDATPAHPDAALMERVRTGLQRARDDMAGWAAYADEYFREKHDLAGDLAAIDALLSDLKAEAGR